MNSGIQYIFHYGNEVSALSACWWMCVCWVRVNIRARATKKGSKIIRNRVISSINSILAQLFRLALIFLSFFLSFLLSTADAIASPILGKERSTKLTSSRSSKKSSVHCFCVFSVRAFLARSVFFSLFLPHSQHDFYFSIYFSSLSLFRLFAFVRHQKNFSPAAAAAPSTQQSSQQKQGENQVGGKEEKRTRTEEKLREWEIFLLFFLIHVLTASSCWWEVLESSWAFRGGGRSSLARDFDSVHSLMVWMTENGNSYASSFTAQPALLRSSRLTRSRHDTDGSRYGSSRTTTTISDLESSAKK